MTVKDIISSGEMSVSGNRITLHFATLQVVALVLSLTIMAAGVVFAVWLTTRDLSTQVSALAAAVTDLRETFGDHEKRLSQVEIQHQVTTEIQRRVLKALAGMDDPKVRKRLNDEE